MANAHAQAYQRMRGVKISCCCDVVKKKAKAFARQYEIPQWYTDYEEMLVGEELDGVKVYGYPSYPYAPYGLRSILSRISSVEYYRRADADVYHSQAVSYNTLVAQSAAPDRCHAITFQDPYDLHEWNRISKVDPRYRLTAAFRVRLAVENSTLARACRKADSLSSQAKYLIPKAERLFRLDRNVSHLPNPVDVPKRRMRKAPTPTVCFLARWDPQKRVELFFNLARRFPDVHFIAMGRSHDPAADVRLREAAKGIPNLTCTGFVSEEEKSQILERSWALVNTSAREALPVSFLEALAHETPIISGEDPDGLTTAFGYPVNREKYAQSLKAMLSDEVREERGAFGREYVEEVHEVGKVVDRHVEMYANLIDGVH